MTTIGTVGLKIAHISDPHMTSLTGVPWGELLNKRILGYLSWKLKRRHSHSAEVLSRILDDLFRQQPDHIIISGDLTHLGTANECREAGDWLNSLGETDDISVVPGNHDAYVSMDFTQSAGQWLPYMQSDVNTINNTTNNNKDHFPYLRIRDPVAMIGLSTAIPTGPFFATGKLGESQLQGLEDLLETTARQGLYRIVVLHHSPQPGASSFRRRLIDANPFISVIKNEGAELILHGHGHRQIHHRLNADDQLPPVFGVPSASANYGNPEKKPGYNLYRVERSGHGWLMHAESYVMDDNHHGIEKNFSREFKKTA